MKENNENIIIDQEKEKESWIGREFFVDEIYFYIFFSRIKTTIYLL